MRIELGLVRAEDKCADLVLFCLLHDMEAERQNAHVKLCMCQYYRNGLIITSLMSLFLECH